MKPCRLKEPRLDGQMERETWGGRDGQRKRERERLDIVCRSFCSPESNNSNYGPKGQWVRTVGHGCCRHWESQLLKDPSLRAPGKEGEMCFLVLYPYQRWPEKKLAILKCINLRRCDGTSRLCAQEVSLPQECSSNVHGQPHVVLTAACDEAHDLCRNSVRCVRIHLFVLEPTQMGSKSFGLICNIINTE